MTEADLLVEWIGLTIESGNASGYDYDRMEFIPPEEAPSDPD